MVYQTINKRIIVFLLLFLFPLFSYSFDTEYAHPTLTEEIVKYYNHFAKRKITEEELNLIKQGSILEDTWPRWVNHFYVVFNSTGLNLDILKRALGLAYEGFIKMLPYQPLKSPEWAKSETIQSRYLDNRAYQRAKRLYFENKNEAFKTLGHLLHLIEDLGIPDHSRGDSHSGKFNDNLSGYEDYAEKIFKNYNVNFSKFLAEKGEGPYYFKNLDEIFDSLARFTASNWFSEDTIDLFGLPKWKIKKEFSNFTYYYDINGKIILKEIKESNFKTTDDIVIHQSWFNSVIPEILKHGAAFLNLYFSEIEEMEKEEAIKFYEFDIGRRVEFTNFLGFFSNFKSYLLSAIWQGAEKSIKTISSLAFFINSESPIIKTEYLPESFLTKNYLEEKITYQEESNLPQTKITYQEEKIGISVFPTSSEKINFSPTLKPTLTEITTTSTITEITTSTIQEEPKIIYVSGGFIENRRKDLCEDYKNKNYSNILISEIQFETKEDIKDEFIELYNPTDQEIDLTCWSLEKYSSKRDPASTPTLTTLIPQSKFQGKIKPFSFFLITSFSTKEKYQGNLYYAESYSISKNNTIILRKPNNEISDLVGYGDNQDKIYQFENLPFLAQNFENKSIQRKNFQDTNNNLKDFWLRKPFPENSNSPARKPREDFLDLTQIKIENFQVSISSTEEEIILNISFQEPNIKTSSTNYAYDLLIATSTGFATFKLEDFGSSSNLPLPQFNSSTLNFQTLITKCPTTSTLYYFALYLKDLLDEENKTDLAIASITLPEELCNPQEPIIFNTSTITTSTGKILISEIRVLSGTSTDEFIELYNPNDFDVDLTSWEIRKINSKGNEQTVIPSSKFKGVIPAFSYFLLVNSNTSSDFKVEPDIVYSKSYDLAKNNSIRLYDKDGNLIDEFSWSEVDNSKSFNRKKTASSTEETIIFEPYGNAYDTDQNSDFIFAQPNPENSKIKKEIIKKISNFRVEVQDKTYKFSWFSPAFYDKDLVYEIRYSTS
ncbi:MAG: lamin tail domain-containing protein, partial [Candidatus Omnitrophica bacterium]|nr:lamin tail domain-containing protein [Candidatus Omnitrophota bacterium]